MALRRIRTLPCTQSRTPARLEMRFTSQPAPATTRRVLRLRMRRHPLAPPHTRRGTATSHLVPQQWWVLSDTTPHRPAARTPEQWDLRMESCMESTQARTRALRACLPSAAHRQLLRTLSQHRYCQASRVLGRRHGRLYLKMRHQCGSQTILLCRPTTLRTTSTCRLDRTGSCWRQSRSIQLTQCTQSLVPLHLVAASPFTPRRPMRFTLFRRVKEPPRCLSQHRRQAGSSEVSYVCL